MGSTDKQSDDDDGDSLRDGESLKRKHAGTLADNEADIAPMTYAPPPPAPTNHTFYAQHP